MHTYLQWWRVVQLMLVLIVCYALLRVFFKVFGQLYVLWVIAFGGKTSFSNVNRSVRLHLYIVRSSQLDKVSISELYHFALDMVESTNDITIQIFHKILLQYTYVALFRDKTDGSLRGMTLIGVDKEVAEGKKCTVFKVGLLLIKNAYHGSPLIILLMAYYLLTEMILHPFTPLFVICKSFSYKSYLIMTNNFKTFYPRYDRETPEWEKSIMDKFGRSFETMTDKYDPTTGVIMREKSKLKDHVSFISEEDLENPHIRYFNHLNPGWSKGHCLVVMSCMSWLDGYNFIKKIINRYMHGMKAGSHKLKHDGRTLLEESLDEQRKGHIDTYKSLLCEVDPWSKMEGHCLVVMSRLSWLDIFRGIKKTAKRYLYGMKAGSTKVKHDSRGLLEASLDEKRKTLDHIKTYKSTLFEVDPWSKMEVHHAKRNIHNRNYIRTESVSQHRRSDSFSLLPNV